MKIRFVILSIISSFFIYHFIGCTDLFLGPSSSNSSSIIKITINNPVSNDTINYSSTNISYNITQDAGINFIELYVNGTIYKWNPPNSDGSKPVIPLSFDSTYINKRISYYLIYYDKDGFSARSDTMSNILVSNIQYPPQTPSSFTFIRLSYTTINLSWKDSVISNPPGFEIWRKTGYYGNFVLQLVSGPNTNNINDNNAEDTTVYYYKIRSLNTIGTSPFSYTINTYGDGATHSIPPPIGLTAKALSATKVVLNWNDDIGVENYFKIERRYSWSSFVSIGVVNRGTTQFTDSANGLTGSIGYYYRVKAIASSDSSWSNEVYVQTPWQ